MGYQHSRGHQPPQDSEADQTQVKGRKPASPEHIPDQGPPARAESRERRTAAERPGGLAPKHDRR